MRIRSIAAALVAAGVAFAASAGGPVVLYNNFGAGDSYNTGSGWTISQGNPVNQDWDQGFHFTVLGGDFLLTQLDFAMGFVTGTNSITMTLYDSVGGLPGAALESVVVGGFGGFGNNNPPAAAVFSGSTVLQDGEEYHFIASSANNAWLAWNLNSTGATGRVYRLDLGPWTRDDSAAAAAARVWGEVVPAPGVLALLGLSGLVARRRRR